MAILSDLPMDLLGHVIAFLPNPADRARSRAVCRTWRSAVRLQEIPRMPSAVLMEGPVLLTLDDGRMHRLPSLPDNCVCLDSATDHWLLLGLARKLFLDGSDTSYIVHRYFLHNPFSNTSAPLTMLNDAIFSNHVEPFNVICKFLMRSTVDDFIAVITNNENCRLIVYREGKGVWLPEPCSTPYIHIIDVAFLGETLYGITEAEDLIPLNLALGIGYDAWSDSDTDDDSVDYFDDGEEDEVDYHNHDDGEGEEQEEEQDDYNENEENNTNEYNFIYRHLIESRGKLFLVREHRRTHSTKLYEYTHRVEVLEADANAGAWVPLPIGSGLGGGRALFISWDSCKFVFAPCGNVEEDVVYILNTGEVFDMKSQKSRHGHFCRPHEGSAWLFPPELVL